MTGVSLNNLLVMLGIESWKPVIGTLLLPPVPLLLLVLVGARLMLARRGLGWLLILLAVIGLWLSSCRGTAELLTRHVLRPPAALAFARLAQLKSQLPAKATTAIVVLGGGQETLAPEYGVSNPNHLSLERLRYGLWLSRETNLRVAFSGGRGWAQSGSVGDVQSEAAAAARVAAQDFGRPLTWLEDASRDTRENASRTVALLKSAGIQHIVLVTHGFHMPRALRAFNDAAHGQIKIEPAPMGMGKQGALQAVDWLPTVGGYSRVVYTLHELIGRALGA